MKSGLNLYAFLRFKREKEMINALWRGIKCASTEGELELWILCKAYNKVQWSQHDDSRVGQPEGSESNQPA